MRHDVQVRLVKELLARLDSGTNVDAGGLRKNPVGAYTDPDRADAVGEFFLARPQMIGLSGDLPEPGSFMTVDDLGVPILATRDQDGRFRALVNACRHRGAVLETRSHGRARRFTCQFHAWTYDAGGTLVGLPKQDHFGEIDLDCHDLFELPAVEWNGLLYVHTDPEGEIDLPGLFGDELAGELATWDFGSLDHLADDSYEVACNWKLAMDTFGETYHFNTLHKDTLANGFHGNCQCYDTFGINHRMILTKREIDVMRHEPEDQWDIRRAALPVYWLFPNVQLMPSDTGCYLVRAYPIPGEPGRHVSRITFYLRTDVDVHAMFSERAEESIEIHKAFAEGFADIIRDEDYVMSASQQRTADSGVVTHSLFGRNEPALHHYHSTYRSLLGLDPLPLLQESEV